MATVRLSLPLLSSGQANQHVVHNEAIRVLDAVCNLAVKSMDFDSPPVTPAPVDGDAYIIKSPGFGAWVGHAGKVAILLDGGWKVVTPYKGMRAYDQNTDTLQIYNGTAWNAVISNAGSSIPTLSVNGGGTNANTKFAVNSRDIVLNRATDTINLKMNKEAAANDASITLSTAWSARALIGLLGDDNFTFKVSPDGTNYYTALNINRNNGNVGIGTNADANNRLLVSGTSALFTSTGNFGFVFSKGAAANDASITMQSNFSARMLFGLLGDENTTLKVSPDGSAYKTAVVVDKTSAIPSFPQVPRFAAYINYDKYIPANAWTAVGHNSTVTNDQSAFNAATGKFTAPVTGTYFFSAFHRFKINNALPTQMWIGFRKNASTGPLTAGMGFDTATNLVSLISIAKASGLINLVAGDTIDVMCYFAGNDGYVESGMNGFCGFQVL